MLIGGALFVAGVVPMAWERAPAWHAADTARFRAEFAHTLRRMDLLQPALAVVSLVSSIGFALSASGMPRALAAVAATCFLAVLVGSTVGLVPLQRRLVDPDAGLSDTDVERLRARWIGRHLLRSVVALVAFVLLGVAAIA